MKHVTFYELSRTILKLNLGFLVKETDEYLLVAGEKSKYSEDVNYGHVTKIPKTWIRHRTALKIITNT